MHSGRLQANLIIVFIKSRCALELAQDGVPVLVGVPEFHLTTCDYGTSILPFEAVLGNWVTWGIVCPPFSVKDADVWSIGWLLVVLLTTTTNTDVSLSKNGCCCKPAVAELRGVAGGGGFNQTTPQEVNK